MATIRKRVNENFVSYEVQVRKRGQPRQTKTFRNRADAEKWGRMIEAEMDRGVFVDRSEAESTTLADALNRYLREVTPSKKSATREASRIKKWLQDPLAKRMLSTIKGKDIAEFRDSQRQKLLAENTIRLDIALLSVVFETARKEWGIESLINPCQLIKLPSSSNTRERRLEPKEEIYLLKGLDAHCRNKQIKSVVRFALETAMRQSEILRLEWSDINIQKSTARARDTKNGDDRFIPLSSKAIALLAEQPRSIYGGKIFNVSQDALIRAFQRGCEKGAHLYIQDHPNLPTNEFLKNLRFHDLRHEATSRLFELGTLDVMEVASITGHKALQMLKRYTHLKAENIAKKLA
ncbi:site-specific integrase [Methylovorus mays]|uniref:site-specific integrase n=1 Tax=Methylovorus mays TaxID=184077 RepID=UPI001E4BAA90|nr:site-specific integrase [Methylovorus mays]MCB5206700.1 site-specific integrase [Methylovorus mays]